MDGRRPVRCVHRALHRLTEVRATKSHHVERERTPESYASRPRETRRTAPRATLDSHCKNRVYGGLVNRKVAVILATILPYVQRRRRAAECHSTAPCSAERDSHASRFRAFPRAKSTSVANALEPTMSAPPDVPTESSRCRSMGSIMRRTLTALVPMRRTRRAFSSIAENVKTTSPRQRLIGSALATPPSAMHGRVC